MKDLAWNFKFFDRVKQVLSTNIDQELQIPYAYKIEKPFWILNCQN